jgi:hypothetical protein
MNMLNNQQQMEMYNNVRDMKTLFRRSESVLGRRIVLIRTFLLLTFITSSLSLFVASLCLWKLYE